MESLWNSTWFIFHGIHMDCSMDSYGIVHGLQCKFIRNSMESIWTSPWMAYGRHHSIGME